MTKRPISHPVGLCAADRALVGRFAALVNRRVAVVGSRVKGYWHDGSDYDLVVEGTRHDRPRLVLLARWFAEANSIRIDLGLFDGPIARTHEIVEVP